MSATTVPASPEAIERAAQLLRAGELVAFPTETVYGLGANAMSERSVAAIFSAKGRPRFNPLIVHVPDLAAAEALAEFDARARRIAAQFWPGPLTLVLRRRYHSGLSLLASAGLDTVAIRAPAHPVARFSTKFSPSLSALLPAERSAPTGSCCRLRRTPPSSA